ncbi:MAG: carboxypeptidase regulatory-like domain-containing protein [Planctomycetes bacterium]|nr:carboxypeptidase regulatory-like domain-containing protein [Planctomycetota bacterium]
MRNPRTILSLVAGAALIALGWWWRSSATSAHADPLERSTAESSTSSLRDELDEQEAVAPAESRDEREALAAPAPFGAPALHGIVTTPDERPLAGVRVSMFDDARIETLSDADGSFVFAEVERPRQLVAELAGWIQIAEPEPRLASNGGFDPLQLVMAPVAALQVRVVDAAGDPAVNHVVWVDVSPAEPHGRMESGYRSYQPPRASRTTDEYGVAVFETLAAECRLSVHVDRDLEWVTAGVLGERGPAAVPLVLEAGEERELTARLGTRIAIEGVVLEPNGEGSPQAAVTAYALDLLRAGRPSYLAGVRTDEAGRFRLEGIAAGSVRRVLVTAQSTIGEIPAKSMFGGPTRPDPLCVDSAEVSLDEHGRPPQPIELHVEPQLKLGGVLLDENGQPVAAGVRLVPHDEPKLVDRLISGTALWRESYRDGSFRFTGVPPGRYDVVAHDRGRETVRVDDVESGTEDLVIRFPNGVPARVELIVDGDETLDQLVCLCTRLEPLPGVGDGLRALPREATYEGPFGWPAEALGLWFGAQSYHGSLGSAMFSSAPVQGDSLTLELDEGLYWIGVKASTPGGGLYFPMGTGLVRVTRGDHRLRFRLRRTTSVEGVVHGARVEDGLCVALSTPDGRLVPLDVRRDDMHDFSDLSAGGRFRLESVPTGRFELRVGTAEELRAGASRAKQALELTADDAVHVVELRL